VENGTKIFSNCSCIGGEGFSTGGSCPVDCQSNFMAFLMISLLMKFLSLTGRAGNTILQFRAVEPDDKSMAMGFTEVLMCLLAYIPGPIVYGTLLDQSCLVWGTTCGKTGNCWLYDGKTLRYLLNFTASGFLLLSTLLDVVVLLNVKELKIYEDDLGTKEEQVKLNEEPPRKESTVD